MRRSPATRGSISINRTVVEGRDFWSAVLWKDKPITVGVACADKVLVETSSRDAQSHDRCLVKARERAAMAGFPDPGIHYGPDTPQPVGAVEEVAEEDVAGTFSP